MGNADYNKAKELGLTQADRWGANKEHHPMSLRAVEFMSYHDWKDYGLAIDIKTGGDGDNGEAFMFLLDPFFEMLDILNKR